MSNTVASEKDPNSPANSPERAFLIFIVSFAAALWSFVFLFGSGMGSILMLSVALHELGHWCAFRLIGFRAKMAFIPFMGAYVAPYPMDYDRFDNTPRAEKVFVTAAGPMVNLLIVAFSFLQMQYEWVCSYDTAAALLAINAFLAAGNLVPFGFLDGGRIACLLFSHTAPKAAWRLADIMRTYALFAVLIVFIGGMGLGKDFFWGILLAILTTFAVRMQYNKYQKSQADENPHDSAPPMPSQIASRWAHIWGCMFLVSCVSVVFFDNPFLAS